MIQLLLLHGYSTTSSVSLSLILLSLTHSLLAFKSPSHLLKLAIAHAIAQSTVLATHETAAANLLSSPITLSIPQQLASSGIIKMRRRVALRLTGK
jgi:uncharacterized Rmd1/YagE family protein